MVGKSVADGPAGAAPLLRRLDRDELGPARAGMLAALAASPDPFSAVVFRVRLDRLRAHVAGLRGDGGDGGPRVTLTHAVNRLVGLAVGAHPPFQRIVCGRAAYAVRGVHVTNVLRLRGPGEPLATVVLRDVQAKGLAELASELTRLREERQAHLDAGGPRAGAPERWLVRLGLARLAGERRRFLRALAAGEASNVLLSNHAWPGAPMRFATLKPIQVPRRIALRLHAHAQEDAVVEGGAVVARERLHLLVASDHRLVHAGDLQALGETLHAIAEDPAAQGL